jgi:anhydro-N-acetylmuramic acid kinase
MPGLPDQRVGRELQLMTVKGEPASSNLLKIDRSGPEVGGVFAETPIHIVKRTGPGRLIDIIHKDERGVIGLMSGTSVDALDIVYVRIKGRGANVRVREIVAFDSFPYAKELRDHIFELFDPNTARVDKICQMDFVLAEVWSAMIAMFLYEHNIPVNDIDIIATAGQTIWHSPDPSEFWMDGVEKPIVTGSTFAIGQSAVIAERTGILTVGDLRVRDVAAGGQGAPLVPYADWVLLRHPTLGRAIQNYGGIGNVTYLPPNCGIDRVIAFDTGPANMVIDALAKMVDPNLTCDEDGRLAAAGTVIPELLQKLLADPYFEREPPKTTGREYFGAQYARKIREEHPDASLLDLIATATALTAESIARAYRDFLVSRNHAVHEVVVGGGGPKNPTLMRMQDEAFERYIGKVVRKNHDDFGIPNQAKESVAMAIIGDEGAYGITTNVSGATGGRPTILGKISY